MNVESGFLSNRTADIAEKNEGLANLEPLSTSRTGFFTLFLAKHLGRRVVIKTLKEEYAGNQVAIAQLKKEFSIMFPLASPNVAQVLSLISVAGDIPAIEMEWCDGVNLRELMTRGLNGEDAEEIMRGVLAGLEDIHNAGVVHRDIKPENIMYDPLRKVVKIIDFGCAWLTGSVVLQGPNGTSAYTPAAKIEPDTEAEPKDDLYALGVVTAEMAEALNVERRADEKLKVSLRRFSSMLLDGKYQKADKAAEVFRLICREKKYKRIILVTVVTILAALGSGLLYLYISTPHSSNITSSMEEKTVTIGVDGIMHEEAAPPDEAGDNKGLKIPITQEKAENPEAQLPPPTQDDGIYNLAVNAGSLLREASSAAATLQVRMDAFVVNFCDSLYQADELIFKYPRYIEEEAMRELARELAEEYYAGMEQEFQARFGPTGDQHRRKVLLEGRFYGSLLTFNHNPYYKR